MASEWTNEQLALRIRRLEEIVAKLEKAYDALAEAPASEPLPVASFPTGFVSDELFAIARDCPMSASTRTKLQALCPRIGELETLKMNTAKSEAVQKVCDAHGPYICEKPRGHDGFHVAFVGKDDEMTW